MPAGKTGRSKRIATDAPKVLEDAADGAHNPGPVRTPSIAPIKYDIERTEIVMYELSDAEQSPGGVAQYAYRAIAHLSGQTALAGLGVWRNMLIRQFDTYQQAADFLANLPQDLV